MIRLSTFALIVSTLAACSGDEPGPTPGAGAGAGAGGGPVGGAGGAASIAPDEAYGEIVLPMRTVNAGALSYSPAAQIEGAPDAPKLTLDSDLGLAVGEGYPSRFRVVPPLSLYLACGNLGNTDISLRELEAEPGAIDVRLGPDGSLSFDVREAGETSLVVRGELTVGRPNGCELPVGVALPLEVRILARAVRPAGARFMVPSRCQSAAVPRVAVSTGPTNTPSGSGAPLDLKVMLVDEAGNAIFPSNVVNEAPMTVRARGVFPKSLLAKPPTSLAQMTFSSTKGPVEFVPALGAPLVIEVVDAWQISGAEIQFQLAGLAAGPVSLEDGLVYGESGWRRVANRIAPMVQNTFVGTDPLCSPPPTDRFELTSLTPEVCAVVPLPSEQIGAKGEFYGDPLGQGATLLQDGTCSLTLSLPGFAQGAGLTNSLAVTFQNTAELHDW